MTVSPQKKARFILYFKNKLLSLCPISINIKYLVMSCYISSVLVVLSPKDERSSDSLVSRVLALDSSTGCTISHAVQFVNKNPLIKPYLSKYNIINLVFKYSEL